MFTITEVSIWDKFARTVIGSIGIVSDALKLKESTKTIIGESSVSLF